MARKLLLLGLPIIIAITLILVQARSQENITHTYYLNENAIKDYLNTFANGKIIDVDINNLSNLITTSEPLTAEERNALKQACTDNGVAWVGFMVRK